MSFKGTSLAVWFLGDVENPRLVGEVRLESSFRRCLLELDDEWRRSGFEISPDIGHGTRIHAPKRDLLAPGALDDAMPDRWGERMIRIVFRPPRMSPLDLLWYAGDHRFGALGISSSFDEYRPSPEPPLLHVESLLEAEALITRVLDRDSLGERERQLIASSASLGGAHPKMLIEDEGQEWIAKFPRGSNVDQLLIEHASMELARQTGLDVAPSKVLPGGVDHILLVGRFDRRGSRRVHGVSARTMLAAEADDTYATLSSLLRRHCATGEIRSQQRELFRRMAFNIMIDNTDDHTKNHAFLRGEDGDWQLSPAFDIPPQMNGLGLQAIQISSDPKRQNDFGIGHAMAAAPHFGMSKDEARNEWNEVAGWVSEWKTVFAACGVTSADLDYLSIYLDSEPMQEHRKDSIAPSKAIPAADGESRSP